MNNLKLSSRAKVFKNFGKELVVVKVDKKKLIKEVRFNYQGTLKRLEKFNTGKKMTKILDYLILFSTMLLELENFVMQCVLFAVQLLILKCIIEDL